ncbi:uncharacterized protein LOC118269465 [Spodoptera frugiperda]|uniref:Uncharacterized protein LOC118269465 n=1 Tax=Spodoptera frugiperda TaxID=7108 RepID=A0A9R0D5E5_SPOFR|nr:uncharacterized protein LOC118269465 [Spodoptera frugiperda]
MIYILTFFVIITVSQANSDSIQSSIHKYFKSDGVQQLRKDWEVYRKPIEHSIATALKETVGHRGMNVYINAIDQPIALGYYHDDNHVRLVLKDLKLQKVPYFWMPEVQFSLASNVLKLSTTLSKMIVHAEYSLMRNKSRILFELSEQNPSLSSPFLFQQVQDVGEVVFSIDGCVLSGFVITTLSGDSVNIGYGHYKLIKCVYTVEIYRAGDNSPPVIAKYQPQRDDSWSLGIRDLLIKPIREEVDGKLQAALLSFVNTTSLFGDKLQGYIDEQRKVFAETATFLTDVHRNLNKITIEQNNAHIPLDDHYVTWDSGRSDFIPIPKKNADSVNLTGIVLSGLDSMYSAHIGGPYKMGALMIAEEMRFSTLQVRFVYGLNKAEWPGETLDQFAFSTEIKDLTVNLQMEVRLDKSTDKTSILKGCTYKILQVTGFRRMTTTLPGLMHGLVENLVYGHLLNELPRIIRAHLKAILRTALRPPTTTPPPVTDNSGLVVSDRPAVEVECSEGDDDTVNRRDVEIVPPKNSLQGVTSRTPVTGDWFMSPRVE